MSLSFKQVVTHSTFKIFLLLLSASVLLYLNLQTYGIWLMPDSLNYLEVAENLAIGKGLVLGYYALTPTATTPLTAWTPLYPIVLSWFIHGENSLLQQAIFPALLLYAASGLLLFLVLKHFTNVAWALAGCGVWLLSVPAWTVYHYAWSESLFITLALLETWLLTLWFSIPSEKGRGYAYFIIIASTVVMTALFYTRYIGISFIPLFGLLLFFPTKSKYTYKFWWLAAGICYVGLISLWLWRNDTLTGTLSGAVRSPSTVSLLDNISNVGNAYLLMFPSHIIGYLVSSLLAILIVLRLRKSTETPMKVSPVLGVTIIILSMGGYLLVLVLLRTWQEFDPIGVRLVSPSVPFFIFGLIILGFLCSRLSTSFASISLFLVIWILAAISLEGARTYIDARMQLSNHKNFLFKDSPTETYNNFSGLSSDNLLPHIINELDKTNQATFVVEQVKIAAIMHIAFGKKVKLLPAVINEAEVKKLNQLGEGFLILMDTQRLHQYYQQHFNKLSIYSGYLEKGFWVTELPLPTIPKNP
ncbi:MAG: hypothetical protein PHP00_08730 [Thiotrichaceae bacterium]|nr:hypothetical protein [Thiotrichaceae bacterium]